MNDEPTRINKWGNKIWKNSEGKLHRDGDLPAFITYDGKGYCWYRNGNFHRDHNLPAEIHFDNFCRWWINGVIIKDKYCTQEEAEEYRKPYYFQKLKKTEFNRFERLIK